MLCCSDQYIDMIFVTLGNQNFPFHRLLDAVERAKEEGIINEEVIVQNGYTEFTSSHMKMMDFLSREEFDRHISEARLVITHAGTGSIITCLRKHKKVLAAARSRKYGEHIDDHQQEILEMFSKKNYIVPVKPEYEDLKDKLVLMEEKELNEFQSNTKEFNDQLIELIDDLFK